MNKICFIKDCSLHKQKNTSFHRFPSDLEASNSWSKAINNLNNQQNAFTVHRNSYVCGHHFSDSDKCIKGKKTMLNKLAVPSIFPRQCEVEQGPNVIGEVPPVRADNVTEANPSQYESDREDFFGFEAHDLITTTTGITVGQTVQTNTETKQSVSYRATPSNTSDSKEVDDEIIFIENNVEVIEIDDDEDNEITQTVKIKKREIFSKCDIQQMLATNNPLVQLQKPKLDWKSDQFRLIYVDGVNQNLYTCTKCWELFEEINIDNVVRHARCNPTPSVSPPSKRKKLSEILENASTYEQCEEKLGSSVQPLTLSKIQTIAACMDVQSSAFYQSKRFLHFAQFLIDTGASNSRLAQETQYDVLCSVRDQLKDMQSSKIKSVLNNSEMDYTLSCDIWEDCFRRKTNVSMELHYLDESFLLHRIVIGVKSIGGVNVNDVNICDQVLEILKTYSTKDSGIEFLQKAIAFVTSKKLDTQSLEVTSFQSACSQINDIANEIVNESRLKIAEKCLHIIGWLNSVSTEKITEFDARQWNNIYDLFEKFSNKKALFIQEAIETTFPSDDSVLQLLQPFHQGIIELSDTKNNISKVFGVYKSLEKSLSSIKCEKGIARFVKRNVLVSLKQAFADSDPYQICMFLDPSNRIQYNALESDKMDSLQSKIDIMIGPCMAKDNSCVGNDLIHYMDDSVTSQQNQIDLFLQLPSDDHPYKFWRDDKQLPGLKTLARKYFTIPTYVSLSECKFRKDSKDFSIKRNSLDVNDMETMLMMNSSQFDVDHTNFNKLN